MSGTRRAGHSSVGAEEMGCDTHGVGLLSPMGPLASHPIPANIVEDGPLLDKELVDNSCSQLFLLMIRFPRPFPLPAADLVGEEREKIRCSFLLVVEGTVTVNLGCTFLLLFLF